MHKRHYLSAARFFFGALALSAVIFQFVEGTSRESFSGSNFLSFFTIQGNILAGGLLLFMGILRFQGHSLRDRPRLQFVRGAATLYMAMTGVIYVLLLSGLETSLQTPTPWVNTVLHYIMPLYMVVDWFIDTPPLKLTFRKAVPWVWFPLAYVVYTLLRGLAVDWYPYPFLNPAHHGYLGILATSVIILPTILAFVAVLAWSTRRRHSGAGNVL